LCAIAQVTHTNTHTREEKKQTYIFYLPPTVLSMRYHEL